MFKDHDLYKNIISQALEQWKKESPDRIVFTGDLVHSKNQMTPELIDMVVWVLSECSKIAKTILIIGNHDFLENNISRMDALSPIIESLKNDNIVFYKERGVYTDDNVDWCVYSLVSHNIPPEINKSENIKIGLFHGPIQGLTTDIGYTFEEGYEIEKFKGCDIVLCGDIHKRQVFDIPNGKKAYMVGSTIQQNFGETIMAHGYGIYELETNNYRFVNIDNPKPFLSFKINSIEDLESGKEILLNY